MDEQRIAVVQAVQQVGSLGNAAHMHEVNRRERLGRPVNLS